MSRSIQTVAAPVFSPSVSLTKKAIQNPNVIETASIAAAIYTGNPALAISGVSAGEQMRAGQKAEEAAKKQAAFQVKAEQARGKMAEIQAHRERIAQVREARIRKAQILSHTGLMGQGTSGISGATSSVESQMVSNIGTIGQTQTFAEQASFANQQAAFAGADIFKAQQQQQMWQTIFSMAAPTKAEFKDIFATSNKT